LVRSGRWPTSFADRDSHFYRHTRADCYTFVHAVPDRYANVHIHSHKHAFPYTVANIYFDLNADPRSVGGA
jgi:hypothetical protein